MNGLTMAEKTQNQYFEGIRSALLEVSDTLEKGKKLTCREVTLPEPPHKMSGKEIADLRQNKLNVSQYIFALLLNVSPKTIQAWEQNVNTPSGPALRLLWLVKNQPDILRVIFA